MKNSKLIHIKETKYEPNIGVTQPANWSPGQSQGRRTPTSPGRPLKILFDHPGNIQIWRLGDVPTWRPGDVLKWRPGNVLIWRSWDVPGRFNRDLPRCSQDVPYRTLRVLKLACLNFFLTFLSELIRLT